MPSVAKFARLNLKGLTLLRIKKTRTGDATVWKLLTIWHNLCQCR